MKRSVLFLSVVVTVEMAVAAAFEHAICDSVSLDGEWEMAYQPYANESVEYPEFSGVRVVEAVPGYWEDMEPAFRVPVGVSNNTVD